MNKYQISKMRWFQIYPDISPNNNKPSKFSQIVQKKKKTPGELFGEGLQHSRHLLAWDVHGMEALQVPQGKGRVAADHHRPGQDVLLFPRPERHPRVLQIDFPFFENAGGVCRRNRL